MVVNLRAYLQVVLEEVINHLLVFVFVQTVPKVSENYKSDVMPSIMVLIEGMNQLETVQSILHVPYHIIVQGSLGCVVSELTIHFLL
jgi:hypothetical protein